MGVSHSQIELHFENHLNDILINAGQNMVTTYSGPLVSTTAISGVSRLEDTKKHLKDNKKIIYKLYNKKILKNKKNIGNLVSTVSKIDNHIEHLPNFITVLATSTNLV